MQKILYLDLPELCCLDLHDIHQEVISCIEGDHTDMLNELVVIFHFPIYIKMHELIETGVNSLYYA